MFTVEIRVNSTLVTHIYGRNITPGGFEEDNEGKSLYDFDTYDASSGEKTKGTVTHNRGDGLNILVLEILKKATKPKRTRKLK